MPDHGAPARGSCGARSNQWHVPQSPLRGFLTCCGLLIISSDILISPKHIPNGFKICDLLIYLPYCLKLDSVTNYFVTTAIWCQCHSHDLPFPRPLQSV